MKRIYYILEEEEEEKFMTKHTKFCEQILYFIYSYIYKLIRVCFFVVVFLIYIIVLSSTFVLF